MKTKETKKIEQLLYDYTKKLGIYGCFEVKIGFSKSSRFLTGKEEYVDYMTYASDGTIRCYEIKVSESDAKSKAELSFLGNYNYLVMPDELYQLSKDKEWFKYKTWSGAVGVIVVKNDALETVKKPKKNVVSAGVQVLLLESLTKSLSRETDRYYNLILKDGFKTVSKSEYNELVKAKKEMEHLQKLESKNYSKVFYDELEDLIKLCFENERFDSLDTIEMVRHPEIILNKIKELLKQNEKTKL